MAEWPKPTLIGVRREGGQRAAGGAGFAQAPYQSASQLYCKTPDKATCQVKKYSSGFTVLGIQAQE